jgi:hypothetical protein
VCCRGSLGTRRRRGYAKRRVNPFRWFRPAWLGSWLLLGCSSEGLDEGPEAAAPPPANLATLTDVYTPSSRVPLSATALAFNPTVTGELWLALRQFPSGLPCTMTDDRGCAALPGVMAVISGATGSAAKGVIKQDGNAWHFMRRPAAMAWGEQALFASCGESLTDNYEDVDIPYAGPALWSSDPSVFGVKPLPGQNGTHLDMLHETPYCMGIAHEQGNAFWAFNGDAGSLDRVDFHAPHQIGGEDHADGEVHRYVAGQLLRVAEVPSHLAYDSTRGLVYVADTGHGRIVSVDPSSSTPGADIDVWEQLQGSGEMDGATLRELVPPGTLQQPSGLWLAEDTLYVSDNATSQVHAFDTSGNLQKSWDTALLPGSLAGLTLGPDGLLYLANLQTGRVHRFDPAP